MTKVNEIYTSAQVRRDTHKVILKLCIDREKDVRQLYAEIIPLGLAEYFRKHGIDPTHYNYNFGANIVEEEAVVNS